MFFSAETEITALAHASPLAMAGMLPGAMARASLIAMAQAILAVMI
jgi:hypothetical protein